MKLANLNFLAIVGLIILSILSLGVETKVNGIGSDGAPVSFRKWTSIWGSRALKETCGVDGPILDARRQWINKVWLLFHYFVLLYYYYYYHIIFIIIPDTLSMHWYTSMLIYLHEVGKEA